MPNDFLTVTTGQSDCAQAQFVSNHLVVRDKGMTDEERCQTHAAYRAFATEVNVAAEMAGVGLASDEDVSRNVPLRIVDEILDVLPDHDGVLYYHCLTRDHFRMSHTWHEALELLRRHQPLTREDLSCWLAHDQASTLIDRLHKVRLLAAATAGHTTGECANEPTHDSPLANLRAQPPGHLIGE